MPDIPISLENDFNFLVGTYNNLDVLVHQPHAPTSGEGIYSMSISRHGDITQLQVTESLNSAVLIPHIVESGLSWLDEFRNVLTS